MSIILWLRIISNRFYNQPIDSKVREYPRLLGGDTSVHSGRSAFSPSSPFRKHGALVLCMYLSYNVESTSDTPRTILHCDNSCGSRDLDTKRLDRAVRLAGLGKLLRRKHSRCSSCERYCFGLKISF